MLKPVDEDILINTLHLIRAEIDNEQRERLSKDKYCEIAIEKVLYSYLKDTIRSEVVNEFIFAAMIDQNSYPINIITLMIDASSQSNLGTADINIVKKVFKEMLGEGYNYKVFFIDRSRFLVGILLYQVSNKLEADNKLERIRLRVNNELHTDFFMAVSPSMKEESGIDDAIKATLMICQLQFAGKAKISGLYYVNNNNENASIVMKIINYLSEHYHEEISLKSIASRYFVNPVYLGRLFTKETGISFNEYINKLRIDAAVELLKDGRNKVEQVCRQVGYSDIVYFYKKFKELKGVTPSSYRPVPNNEI